MTQQEKIADALTRVQAARRTLALARQVQANAFDPALISDVVCSLAKQAADAEREAAKAIGARGAPLGDGYVSVARSDRRGMVRPAFHYRHSLTMEVVR